ncbi:hypothetical protein [Parasitella parasitica]|uniref:Uncharacterized protein n=1 Tax=Parasitella parasitica TaxID=35722 RepID=A0A0B7N1A4_9FUNG|nr:hypothetical protein [Parasitella parasitica]
MHTLDLRSNSTEQAITLSPSPPRLYVPWAVVTAGKGKHRNKIHQLISFKPTFVQPRSATTESNQTLSGQAPPAPVELVVPYIKGVGKALDNFNRDADSDSRGYNEFLPRSKKRSALYKFLIDPSTSEVFDDQTNKLRIAQEYYHYTISPRCGTVIQELLAAIPTELLLQSSPRQSSPGLDGLPFEILNPVMRFPPYKPLMLNVFNDALDHATFPDSWNDSIMTLLKKKGDFKAMGNYSSEPGQLRLQMFHQGVKTTYDGGVSQAD